MPELSYRLFNMTKLNHDKTNHVWFTNQFINDFKRLERDIGSILTDLDNVTSEDVILSLLPDDLRQIENMQVALNLFIDRTFERNENTNEEQLVVRTEYKHRFLNLSENRKEQIRNGNLTVTPENILSALKAKDSQYVKEQEEIGLRQKDLKKLKNKCDEYQAHLKTYLSNMSDQKLSDAVSNQPSDNENPALTKYRIMDELKKTIEPPSDSLEKLKDQLLQFQNLLHKNREVIIKSRDTTLNRIMKSIFFILSAFNPVLYLPSEPDYFSSCKNESHRFLITHLYTYLYKTKGLAFFETVNRRYKVCFR